METNETKDDEGNERTHENTYLSVRLRVTFLQATVNNRAETESTHALRARHARHTAPVSSARPIAKVLDVSILPLSSFPSPVSNNTFRPQGQ